MPHLERAAARLGSSSAVQRMATASAAWAPQNQLAKHLRTLKMRAPAHHPKQRGVPVSTCCRTSEVLPRGRALSSSCRARGRNICSAASAALSWPRKGACFVRSRRSAGSAHSPRACSVNLPACASSQTSLRPVLDVHA